jgi:hypothetical protein
VSAGAAECFGFAQIGGVTVHDEHHVTPSVSDDGICVCGSVVKELLALLHGVLGGFCLGRGYRAEHCEYGGVNCPSMLEENTITSWMIFFSGGDSGLYVSSGFVYCTVAPYVGIVCWWGWC